MCGCPREEGRAYRVEGPVPVLRVTARMPMRAESIGHRKIIKIKV